MAAAAPYAQVVDQMSKAGQLGAQLQEVLRAARGGGALTEAGELSGRILDAIYRAIDTAKAAAAAAEDGSEVHSEVTCTGGGGGKRKAAAAGGDKRAGSRRRTQQASVETRTTKEMDDGHAWRKYGQKEIQNSKHPKAYFRCTHKYDQNCQAQRQVQRCDDDPETFRVTYIGAHTCRDPAAAPPPLVVHTTGVDAADLHAGSRLISFAPSATTASTTTTTSNHHQKPLLLLQADDHRGAAAALLLPPLKLEGGDQEEVLSSLTPAGSSAAAEPKWNAAATPGGPDQGDVTSGLHFGDGDVGFPMCGDDGFDLLEDLFPF